VLDQELILGGWFVDGIRDPCVPSGLYLRGVKVVHSVVNPSRPQWKFFVVLVVLVAELVLAYETAPFCVACRMPSPSSEESASRIRA
jgi:hypothetical protein